MKNVCISDKNIQTSEYLADYLHFQKHNNIQEYT